MSETDAEARVRAVAQRLAAAGARDEALARYEPERRRVGIPRAARMRPIGRVWRLGALLVGADGRLWGTGRVVRAERAVRRGATAAAIAEHRAYRAAAVRGGYPEGETVNFGAAAVDFDALARSGESGPLTMAGRQVMVRWSSSLPSARTELSAYLDDRAELLINPPESA